MEAEGIARVKTVKSWSLGGCGHVASGGSLGAAQNEALTVGERAAKVRVRSAMTPAGKGPNGLIVIAVVIKS